MTGVYCFMVSFLLALGVFAEPVQKQATSSDALVQEAALLWKRGEKKQAVEKIKQSLEIDPHRPDIALSRFLNSAIRSGNSGAFAVLVEAGAMVGKDNDEFLLYVIGQPETPTVEMVALLIEKGARVNQTVRYKTALMHAASEGHVDIARFLLVKGAEINTQTDEGAALMMAVRRGDPQMVKLLLDAGADVHAKHRLGNTPLIMSAAPSIAEMNAKPGGPAPPPSSEIMSLLLAKGADANGVGQWGRTALMETSSVTKVNLLLARGAQVNAKDESGATALTRAVDRGDVAIVEALLKAGASGIDAQNEDGETILMRAIRENKREMVGVLLAHGADVEPVDVLGDTASVLAYEKDLSGFEALSKSVGPVKMTPAMRNAWLRAAVTKKDEAKVRELLAAGADARHEYPIGYRHMTIKRNVLIDAAKVGHAGIVQLLLAHGADPSAKGLLNGSEHGLKFGTALEAVEESQNADVIALLRKAIAGRN